MKLLFHYLKQHRWILAGTLGLAAINQGFSLVDPQIFRILIDRYISRVNTIPHEVFLRGIILLLLISVGAAMVSRIAKNFQDYFVNVITQRVGTAMYANSVEHSFSLPYAVFEDQRSGEFLQKMQKAKLDSQNLIESFINIAFFSTVGIVFVMIYAFTVHWLIGLAYFLLIPILVIVTFLISKKIKAAQEEVVKRTADLSGSTTETLRNVELVKSLGLENQEIRRLNDVNEEILQLELKKIRIIRSMSFIQGTVINGLRSALLLLMLWLILQAQMTLGQFFSLLFYSFLIFNPLSQLGQVTSYYQQALASLGLLEEILKSKPEKLPTKPVPVGALSEIKFQDLSFKYQSAKNQSLKNINLTLHRGQTVAFVGPSGSGKSTLVKLLLGLYHPKSGELQFNGQSSKKIDLKKLRHRVGLVSQETQLFAGTIRENLLFVNPKASDKDCLNVLGLAAAESLVKRGDKGLDTRVGEGGLKLSGGERQRLAIARALLRNPDLIIFDEATSSLDSITEKAITRTIQDIENVKPNLITVMVAHRLSTIAHAKTIYVLEQGKIIEQGAHSELLKKGGLYTALWREQIGRLIRSAKPLIEPKDVPKSTTP